MDVRLDLIQPEASNPALCPLRPLEVRAELSHLSPNFIIPSRPKRKKNPFIQVRFAVAICTCLISILGSVAMLLL